MRKWSGKTGKMYALGCCNVNYEVLINILLTEHYIEDDLTRTFSGIERYWVFELSTNIAIGFIYSDIKKELFTGTNDIHKISLDKVMNFFPFPFEESQGILWE